MQKLFTEFNITTAAQWKEQLVKDLKGVDFDQLIWHTDNGFDINPFYTKEDLQNQQAPVFTHSDWNIGFNINVSDEKAANQIALEALNGGVSCLSFCLDGTKDLSILLKDIMIEYIAVQFILNSDINAFEKQITTIIAERNLKADTLNLVVNYDVLAHLAEHGSWLANKKDDLNEVTKIAKLSFNTIKLIVEGTLYQNSGANQVTELALIISHYNEYLNYFTESNFDLTQLKKGIQFNVAVGSDFFGEIAKLRALQKLVALVNSTYNFIAPIFISCTTSQLTLAPKDVHTNLLRSTTEAMSAVIGGCSTLYVTQFDELLDAKDRNLSVRMARNQQIILKEESYLNKASDIGAGSYYIESLTEQLATNAFELFKTWETKGGFMVCLEQGIIQTDINKQAQKLKEKTATGDIVIIGVNKYINLKDQSSAARSAQEKNSGNLFEPIKALRLAETFVPEQTIAK
ncbi:MAG: methylmalonyl-CoA mutase family protein [Bacteroidota bacterium]